jgi:hypothetical protein
MKNLHFKEDNLSHAILKLILYFAIALYPIYLFPSGTIQISHFLLIIFSILTLIHIGISPNKYFFTFSFLLIYIYFVEGFYVFYDIYEIGHFNLKYLKGVLFLTYNFILTVSLMSFLNHKRRFNVILYGLATAILIILFSILYEYFFKTFEYRFQSYFNNPNQLGYFSVCCFSLIYLFYRNLYISYYFMIASIVIVVLFSILTLSKAAFISLFLCVVFVIKPYNYKYSKIIIAILLLLIILFMTFFYQQILETHVFSRFINTLNENDSSLKMRGYFVYFEANYLEAIFGMGPKKIHDLQGYEVHSTFMMILSSYGFIGFSIFSLLILFWALDIKKSYGFSGVICVCAPSILYGLTHNGIRFSMFWIIFATSIFLSKELIKQKKL